MLLLDEDNDNGRLFLQPDMSDAEATTVIKQKIAMQEPFSVVRFGDGEISFFRGDHTSLANADCFVQAVKSKICDRWGYHFPDEFSQARRDLLKVCGYAVEHSDLVGFSFRGEKKRRWVPTRKFAAELGYIEGKQRILRSWLMRSKPFGEIRNFKKILQGRPVRIISPYVRALKAKRIDRLLQTNVSYTLIVQGKPLHVYQNNLDTLLSIKEKVVLFGTSNLKNIGAYLKQHLGVVSIDMGATLAAWAGREERGGMVQGECWDYLVVR